MKERDETGSQGDHEGPPVQEHACVRRPGAHLHRVLVRATLAVALGAMLSLLSRYLLEGCIFRSHIILQLHMHATGAACIAAIGSSHHPVCRLGLTRRPGAGGERRAGDAEAYKVSSIRRGAELRRSQRRRTARLLDNQVSPIDIGPVPVTTIGPV